MSLKKAYNTNEFREIGHQLVDLMADHIENIQLNREEQVLTYRAPDEELAFWQKDFAAEEKDLMSFFQNVLDHSIQLHHPRYMGHQVSVPALVSSLAGMVSDLLSNGTGVYEMGMAANAIEKIITDFTAQKIGYDTTANGFLTSGGTLANLTALLAARKAKAPNPVWEEGHQERLAVMVSEQAHYCIDRAARIMGLGSEGIIKVPTDEQFKIKTDVLEEYLANAKDRNLTVIAIVGCACTTSTGSYDDLNALADFASKHQLWLHIDGAHGGAVVFSQLYKPLVEGIERADSVVIDFHKMLMTPALNTALIFKNGQDAYKTFAQKAEYLWEAEQAQEWYHSGKRTFECTKLMMSIKVYAIIKANGVGVFAENVDRLYTQARQFAAIIDTHPKFELALTPEANIINFRFIDTDPAEWDRVNAEILREIISKGQFYIVQTIIRGKRYLRISLMNPHTTIDDFKQLLTTIIDLPL